MGKLKPAPTRWKPKTLKEQKIYREWKAYCIRGARRTRRLYAWRQARASLWDQFEDEQYNRFGDQLKNLQRTVNGMVANLKYPQLFEMPDHDKRVMMRLEHIELQARLMRRLLLKEIHRKQNV